jgi:hypothetical protein
MCGETMNESNRSQHSAPIEFSEEQVRAAREGKGKGVFAQALKRLGEARPTKQRDAKAVATRRTTKKK